MKSCRTSIIKRWSRIDFFWVAVKESIVQGTIYSIGICGMDLSVLFDGRLWGILDPKPWTIDSKKP